MSETSPDRRSRWRPRPRPDWVRHLNEEGRVLDSKSVVPLDEESLLRCAIENTGLDDFGDDQWREPFRILLRSIEEEANLNLMGRIYTRSDLLIHLEGRLQITDWYKQHPETDEEQIREPVFVTGLPRSGTTIMQEILGADPGSRTVKMWEAKFPCPPPGPDDSRPDARIAKADAITTMQDRITPEWAAMHKVGGELPVECIEFMYSSFVSDAFSASFQVPTYSEYVAKADQAYPYWWHKRVLKLLQSRWRPERWLLKGPTHIPFLPTLFEVYPDAKLVLMLRDPVKALASVVDVCGTLFWMRSDDPFSGDSYGHFLSVDPVVQNLRRSRVRAPPAVCGSGHRAAARGAACHAGVHREQAEGKARRARLRNGYRERDRSGAREVPALSGVLRRSQRALAVSQAELQERIDRFSRACGLGYGEAVEAVRCAGEDLDLGGIAGCGPLRVHEQAVIEQRVEGADREQRGAQSG
jgi:hypothetical protein